MKKLDQHQREQIIRQFGRAEGNRIIAQAEARLNAPAEARACTCGEGSEATYHQDHCAKNADTEARQEGGECNEKLSLHHWREGQGWCDCRKETRLIPKGELYEGGGWRERFDKEFPKIPNLITGDYTNAVVARKSDIKAFIEAELKATEERTRRGALQEAIEYITERLGELGQTTNPHEAVANLERLIFGTNPPNELHKLSLREAQTLVRVLSRLQGNGDERDS